MPNDETVYIDYNFALSPFSLFFSFPLLPTCSVIPKNATIGSSASAEPTDDVEYVRDTNATQNMFRKLRGLNDDFVFVTPKSALSKKAIADGSATASGESFISCDGATSSTTEGVVAKNKRKRVRRRKNKKAGEQEAEITVASSFEVLSNAVIRSEEQPIVPKSNNTHVRYVQMLRFILFL